MKQAATFEYVDRDDALSQNLYYDRNHNSMAVKILPGEYYVSTAGELIVTVLGSCISACIRDPELGIGGMNHFMLPHREGGGPAIGRIREARYGTYAMECLINGILKLGGRKSRLEVKIFGGGQILDGMTDIGQRNITFIRDFLRNEGLRLSSEDVGGRAPRKVYYFAGSGRARVKKLGILTNDTLLSRETSYLNDLEANPPAGNVELF